MAIRCDVAPEKRCKYCGKRLRRAQFRWRYLPLYAICFAVYKCPHCFERFYLPRF